MAKSDRILSFFPPFYAAADRTKLLHKVVRMIALPLEEADTHLFRIQRSHRLKVAESAEDIIRLSGLLNLTGFHFEDILSDKALDYSQKLDLMRERVQRIARIHLKGLGTPWAVMESAAIFLNAIIVPEKSGDPLVKHLDNRLFSHKAEIEFSHLPEKPRERIYLHENPLRRKKIDLAERWPMDFWAVENENFENSHVRLVIQGVEDRTVLPSIFCPDTGEGVLFNGIVPDGKMLVIDKPNGTMLDNLPVDEWLIYFKGGIYDYGRVNGANFVDEQDNSSNLFDGDLDKIPSRPFRKNKPVPEAPVGRSEWRFKVAQGVYDGDDFDFSVYATDHEPIGIYDEDFNFDESVFDFPASGVVGMAWDERIPCSFKLLLPSNVPRPQSQTNDATTSSGKEEKAEEKSLNYISRIGNVLPRFKAAGVLSFVDTAKDTWILGESVVRQSAASEGEGVEFHATQLQNHNADILVPLDRTS